MATLILSVSIYGGMLLFVGILLAIYWKTLSPQVQALGKVFSFLVCLVLIYQFVGWKITMMTGGEKGMVARATGVSIENGEAIYWGRGRCTTCHSLGGRGSAIRCPNHGVLAGKFETAMGERMFSRAKEREAATGEKWHGVDYLWECLGDPGGYVVKGYKNEMPVTYKPPINLNLEDIQSVIMYLWSQEGEPDINLVLNPPGPGKKFLKLIKKTTAEAATASPFKTYIDGDAEAGKQMFFDAEGPAPCIKCHTVQLPGAEKATGGEVGPALTTVASTRSVEFIIESILKPSAVIASGFEPIKVETVDGEIITGVNAGVSDTEVKVKLSTGEEIVIPTNQLKGGKFGANPKLVINTFSGKVKGWFLGETLDAIEILKVDGSKATIQKTTIKSRIKMKDKKKIEGYIKAEDEENITVVVNIQGKGFDAYKGGKELVLAKKDIKKIRRGYRKPTIMSTMPGNFSELLTVKNLHDVVAFLKSLST